MMIVKGKEIPTDLLLELDGFDAWLCCKACGEYRSNCDCNHSTELSILGYGTCQYCEDAEVKKVEWHGIEEREVRLCDPCATLAGWEV